MNTVYFANSTPLDLDFIRLMGVSVKDTDNPIGFFGTGLKYAIATLLRHKHEVTITVEGVEYTFGYKNKMLRGREVPIVYMNDEQLPFSLELGKNWKVWQAFRELYSNTRDEGGTITNEPSDSAGTIIAVTGNEFHDCFSERHKIVLEDAPFFQGTHVSVHRKPYPGEAYVFYRGIRANTLGCPCKHNYNFTSQQELTEDRTIESSWRLQSHFTKMVMKELDDDELLQDVLLAGDMEAESWLFNPAWYTDSPSTAFLDFVYNHRHHPRLNKRALEVWRKERGSSAEYEDVALTEKEISTLAEAKRLLTKLDCAIDFDNVRFVRTLGPDILGRYANGKIFIARSAFESGITMLAGTLYEEYLHAEYGYVDESRSLQNYLLNKVITLVQSN